jgi:hypothetical protein
MYRILLLSFVLFAFFSPAQGQLKGGLKGGLNLTDLIITDGASYFEGSSLATRATYHFGTYVSNNFSEHFGYQVEMLFSNKGYTLKTDSLNTNVSLNYLNWPLLLVYNLTKRLDFHAGIELGLLVTGEPIYQDFDLGIDVGVEYNLSDKFLAGLRYSHGFPFKMDIDDYDYTGPQPSYQHSLIQFYVGFNLVRE